MNINTFLKKSPTPPSITVEEISTVTTKELILMLSSTIGVEWWGEHELSLRHRLSAPIETIKEEITRLWEKEHLPMTSKKDGSAFDAIEKMIYRPETVDKINLKKIEWFLHKTAQEVKYGEYDSETLLNIAAIYSGDDEIRIVCDECRDRYRELIETRIFVLINNIKILERKTVEYPLEMRFENYI